MATINYKCDTCKRQIELVENKSGLTTTGRCVITKDCRGILHFIARYPNNLRESIPSYDPDLDDYVPRKLLHVHNQTVENTDWLIAHNFGNSIIFIVYGSDGNIIPISEYTISTISPGNSLIKFTNKLTGTAHVVTRTGGVIMSIDVAKGYTIPISYNDVITFAIPKYLTRIDSQATPITPYSGIPPSPPPPSQSPTPIPLPPPTATPALQMASPCNNTIRLEIEITRPGEDALVCTETLEAGIDATNTWYGWSQILLRNRKQYCLRTKKISKLNVFANVNDETVSIPDGTQMRITRIDYFNGNTLVNIPDRGLLILLSKVGEVSSSRNLDEVIDCGELVSVNSGYFTFNGKVLYATGDMVEQTYPSIRKFT
jgi:hypothetical protein